MLVPQHISKAIILIFTIAMTSATQVCIAAPGSFMQDPRGASGRGGFNLPSRNSKSDRKGRAGAKDINEIIANIEHKLEAVLTVVNEGSEVAEQDIVVLDNTLREASTFRAKFAKSELCNYHLLSAWTRYFAGDFKRALKDAMGATKANPDNKDAQATFIAMAMLNKDYKRMAMGWEKIAETSLFTRENSRSSSRRGSSNNSNGILDFNTELITPELLGQTIPAGRLTCLNGSNIEYQFGGQNALCILLWKASADDLAENNDSKDKSRFSSSPSTRRSSSSSRRSKSKNGDDATTARTEHYSNLFISEFENEGLRFIGVNLNDLYSKRGVMKYISTNPWPWAQIMADDPANESFADFLTLTIDEPTLIIVGPDSSIYYAGAPLGFLPRVILTNAFKMPQTDFPDTAPSNTKEDTEPQSQFDTPPAPAETIEQPKPDRQPAAEVKPKAPEKLNPRADSLLQMISFHRKAGKFTGYKKMADYSRMLFQEYPDSSQAKKAQKLLRDMPETYRQQFNITDEEMGL